MIVANGKKNMHMFSANNFIHDTNDSRCNLTNVLNRTQPIVIFSVSIPQQQQPILNEEPDEVRDGVGGQNQEDLDAPSKNELFVILNLTLFYISNKHTEFTLRKKISAIFIKACVFYVLWLIVLESEVPIAW